MCEIGRSYCKIAQCIKKSTFFFVLLKVTTAQPLIVLTSMNVTLALTTVPPTQTASTLKDPSDVAILNTLQTKADANHPDVHGARRPATTT